MTVRGYCPVCGLPVAVKKDGTLRAHGPLWSAPQGWGLSQCDGTGQKPSRLVGGVVRSKKGRVRPDLTMIEAGALWGLIQMGLADIEGLDLVEEYGWERNRERAINRAVDKFGLAMLTGGWKA